MNLKLTFTKCKETKSCNVYQHGDRGSEEFTTLYLKKDMIAANGITTDHIIVTVEADNG